MAVLGEDEGEVVAVGSVPVAQDVSIRPAAAKLTAKRVFFKLIRLLGGIVANVGMYKSDKVLKNLHLLACILRNSRYNKMNGFCQGMSGSIFFWKRLPGQEKISPLDERPAGLNHQNRGQSWNE